jgi:hypothetical protein
MKSRLNGERSVGGNDRSKVRIGARLSGVPNRAIIVSGFSRCGSSAPKGESR